MAEKNSQPSFVTPEEVAAGAGEAVLHIALFPELAMGHLRPFFRLAKSLARKGHRVSFVSTPRNIQRVADIPPSLSPFLRAVAIPMPEVPHLPPGCESSMDFPLEDHQLLRIVIDLLQRPVRSFLEESKPRVDWVVYDHTFHWLPDMARELGIRAAYFSVFSAAYLSCTWAPPDEDVDRVRTLQEYIIPPRWIPFPTKMAFRSHELIRKGTLYHSMKVYDSSCTDVGARVKLCKDLSDIIIAKSCSAFESEWFQLLYELYQKPIVPVGVLPADDEEEVTNRTSDMGWSSIKQWLDSQKEASVLYIAFGTETPLSENEIRGLALGIEACGSPFLWIMSKNMDEMLPEGFLERVKDKGKIYTKWAPQITILSHFSVGGFLTHCGWNSATEGLFYGRVLILFPVIHDQGLNARLLEEKGVGIEIPRDEKDGSFSSEEASGTLRLAMEEGMKKNKLTENVKRIKGVLRDKEKNEAYIDGLIHLMMKMKN